MAVSRISFQQNNGNNPTSGTFDMPASVQADDVVVFWWYSRQNRSFSLNAGTDITSKVNTGGANGVLFIGWCRLTDPIIAAPNFGWTAVSATNSTTVWGSVVFRGVVTSGDPFEAASSVTASTDTINPDPPSVTTVTADGAVITVFGKNNDYTSISAPTGYTLTGSTSSTSGTDGSGAIAFKLMTTAPVTENPGVFTLGGGASTDDGLTWTGAIKA